MLYCFNCIQNIIGAINTIHGTLLTITSGSYIKSALKSLVISGLQFYLQEEGLYDSLYHEKRKHFSSITEKDRVILHEAGWERGTVRSLQ